jgi:hypothetical protein
MECLKTGLCTISSNEVNALLERKRDTCIESGVAGTRRFHNGSEDFCVNLYCSLDCSAFPLIISSRSHVCTLLITMRSRNPVLHVIRVSSGHLKASCLYQSVHFFFGLTLGQIPSSFQTSIHFLTSSVSILL